MPETTAQHITSLHFTALSHRVASHISVSFFPLVQCLTHSLSFFLSQYIYIYISLFPFVSVSHQSRAGRPVFSEHCLSYAMHVYRTVPYSTALISGGYHSSMYSDAMRMRSARRPRRACLMARKSNTCIIYCALNTIRPRVPTYTRALLIHNARHVSSVDTSVSLLVLPV